MNSVNVTQRSHGKGRLDFSRAVAASIRRLPAFVLLVLDVTRPDDGSVVVRPHRRRSLRVHRHPLERSSQKRFMAALVERRVVASTRAVVFLFVIEPLGRRLPNFRLLAEHDATLVVISH